MNKTSIGIPRSMLFYRYRHLWQGFFTRLGQEVSLSPPTTQGTVDMGSSLAVDEACLSLKVFLGHVQSLMGRCDYICVYRLIKKTSFHDRPLYY